ncbi:MAG: substrate-binding domain-containing protein [Pseudomonadota bacterium]
MKAVLVWWLLAMPAGAETLRLALSTSVENSGLAGVLIASYEAATGDEVRAIIAGSGRGLALGAAGDVDAVISHAPELESAAVASGSFSHRAAFMFNDFVLIGPEDDPAGISGAASAAEAFARLRAAQARFLSRGDESGTHEAEKRLWLASGAVPRSASGRWYLETGTGMGATLNTAVALGGYTISDRATWASFANKRGHRIVFEGDPALFNQYAFLPVSGEKHPFVASAAAARFEAWLLGDGQSVIEAFEIAGVRLFTPNARD